MNFEQSCPLAASSLATQALRCLGLIHHERLVGTERWDRLARPQRSLLTDLPVRFQIVGGIVGARITCTPLRSINPCVVTLGRGQLRRLGAPDGRRRGFVQQVVDAEIPEQLEVRPVVETGSAGFVAPCAHRPGTFRIRPHRPCNTARPRHWSASPATYSGPRRANVEKVPELIVRGDLRGRQMAVVVENRLIPRVTVEKLARGWGVEKKVVGNGRFLWAGKPPPIQALCAEIIKPCRSTGSFRRADGNHPRRLSAKHRQGHAKEEKIPRHQAPELQPARCFRYSRRVGTCSCRKCGP